MPANANNPCPIATGRKTSNTREPSIGNHSPVSPFLPQSVAVTPIALLMQTLHAASWLRLEQGMMRPRFAGADVSCAYPCEIRHVSVHSTAVQHKRGPSKHRASDTLSEALSLWYCLLLIKGLGLLAKVVGSGVAYIGIAKASSVWEHRCCCGTHGSFVLLCKAGGFPTLNTGPRRQAFILQCAFRSRAVKLLSWSYLDSRVPN